MLDLMEKIEKACLDKYPMISWFDWQTTSENIATDAVLTVYRVYEGSRGGSDMVEYAYITTYGEVLFFEQKLED